jgi:NAD(P)-dependent dehydrogenase (short-subunit alcohol dehydrogenase family)
MLLKNKSALVTGASKGIGQAIAIALAKDGASVAINYKTDGEGVEKTRQVIELAGGNAVVLQADIGKPDEARNLVAEAAARLGGLDILVNNAARTRFGPLLQMTEEDWEDVVSTNLKGTFFATLEAVRLMRERASGSVINVSSCAASLMVPFHSVYSMTKGGIETLTRQLAVELAPRVRVNCISPGPTSTERNQRYDPEYDRNWGRVIPMKRVALPEEMGAAAVFLASDRSAFITGQVLQVDGGWNLKGHTPDLAKEDFSSDRNLG